MKRYGNLKNSWCNFDALLDAFKEVKKGKSYYHICMKYERNLAVNLDNLLERLNSDTYMPKTPREFYIKIPKERLIQAPDFEDRIVQHALLKVVRPIIENRFIHQTFACIKTRGTHKASDSLKKSLTKYQGIGYYLKLDIKKFFYSISHKKLNSQLEHIIKCQTTLNVLKKFYTNNEGIGLPLGNVTSQVLANLALNPIDHIAKRGYKQKDYFRYMDDIIILNKSKRVLIKILALIEKEIIKLRLKFNNKTCIGLIKNGIDFVGFRSWENKRVIRKRNLHIIKKRIKKNSCNLESIASFLSHAKRTNSIVYVAKLIDTTVPNFNNFLRHWIIKNRGDKYYEIFQS